jgi:uncharacterized protein YggT (Ycf19 family)
VVSAVNFIANLYLFGLILYSLLSFFNNITALRYKMFLGQFYDPVLQKIRNKLIQLGWSGPFDFAPMILFFTVILARNLLASLFSSPY